MANDKHIPTVVLDQQTSKRYTGRCQGGIVMLLLSLFATVAFAQEEEVKTEPETAFWNPSEHSIETSPHPITVQAEPMGRGNTRLAITNNTTAELMLEIRTQGLDYGFEPDNGLRILKSQVDEMCPFDTTDSMRNETWDYAECQIKMRAGQAVDIVIVQNPVETEKDLLADVLVLAFPPEGLPNPVWMYFTDKAITVHKAKPVVIPETPVEE